MQHQEDYSRAKCLPKERLLHDIVGRWAREKPNSSAIIDSETHVELSWDRFDKIITALSIKLIQMNFKKGDLFVTFMPFTLELVLIEYSCFKIGVIQVPLDTRLKARDIVTSLKLIKPKGFAFCNRAPYETSDIIETVIDSCPFVEYFFEVPYNEKIIEDIKSCFNSGPGDDLHLREVPNNEKSTEVYSKYLASSGPIQDIDAAQAIFTTGSTGLPKPALISHRNIICQNRSLGYAFGLNDNVRTLINLPPSHVGGQTIQLMTTLFLGGTAILLPFFDPAKSLQAIRRYNINILGQIPTMFEMEWQLPDYEKYDLSSVELAIFSGQRTSKHFMEKISTMAPRIGTGLSLTETAGFCTFNEIRAAALGDPSNVGFDTPFYSLSIRSPLKENGYAGYELTKGEVGHICFKGSQTFLGYLNDNEATLKTISRDGFLYTYDLGYIDEKGLHFAGRAKTVIKPKGFQVFPGQIEDFFCRTSDMVSACAIVSVKHDVFSEGIMAFVEKRQGAKLTLEELEKLSKGLPSFMRPLHYVLFEHNQLPLNRLGKVDYIRIKEIAENEARKLKSAGSWDEGNQQPET